MLTRLSVKNFRLLRDVTIDVEPGKPIVLIGPNGSGKSSVIQVLDLLGRCARDGLKEAFPAFGGSQMLVTAGQSYPGNEASLEASADRSEQHYEGTYLLRYAMKFQNHGLTAEGIQLKEGDRPPVEVMSRAGKDLWVSNSKTQNKDVIEAPIEELSFEAVKQRSFYRALHEAQEMLAATSVYDGFLTTPLWTRDVREGRLSPFDGVVIEPCPRIDRRGLDLVNALYYFQSSHPDEWDELERSFKAEFPFVQRLEFPADPTGGRIALGWRDRRYPGVRMHGQQMSEGMVTYLCLLAAILTPYPDPATAIAFDEPERHLHPSALHRLVHLLEKLSERTAVFVATHSDRFLDYLSDPAGSLRVCEPSDEGVSIRKLNADALDAWRKDYAMSELRAQGQLDSTNTGAFEP